MGSHKDLRPEDICAVIDTREQTPLDLAPLRAITGTLATGDYSVCGLEHLIALERKSLQDLVMCVGQERDRFEKELLRLRSYETRAIVIESSWGAIALGQWRGQIKPTQVKAALYSWMKHASIIVAGDRTNAASVVSGILFSAARNRFRELQSFQSNLKLVTQEAPQCG